MKGRYQIYDKIKKGGFGKVYRGLDKQLDKLTIVKKVPIIPASDELLFLQQCQNMNNVIRLLDSFSDSRYLYIVMEKLDNYIDLFDLISDFFPLEEKVVKYIFYQVVNVTVEMANLDIYHFDIKDENIVLGYNSSINNAAFPTHVKLIDFGNARYGRNSKNTENFHPTSVFCPPEYLDKRTILPKEFTVWTLGCLLFNLLTRRIPFQDKEEILHKKLTWDKESLPEDLMYITEKCLEKNPKKRLLLENGIVNFTAK
jgi:serine/threonine protein kinase